MTAEHSLCKQVARIRAASRQMVRELGLLESKNPFVEATGPQIHALLEIAQAGLMTVAELARVLNLNQSTTCRTLAELRALGWVETKPLPQDKKRKPVQLTPAGKAKVAQINSTCGSVYQRALERLSPEKRAMVVEAFELYAQALTESRQEHHCPPKAITQG